MTRSSLTWSQGKGETCQVWYDQEECEISKKTNRTLWVVELNELRKEKRVTNFDSKPVGFLTFLVICKENKTRKNTQVLKMNPKHAQVKVAMTLQVPSGLISGYHLFPGKLTLNSGLLSAQRNGIYRKPLESFF